MSAILIGGSMKAKIYVLLIALLVGAMTYLADPSLKGIIGGGISFLVISVIPFLIDLLKDKSGKESLLAISLGLVLAIITFGLIYPFFKDLPAASNWGVLGVLMVFISYLFYVYQKEGAIGFGFSAGEAHGEPALGSGEGISPKVLDTSIVIDGRIIDLALTGFIEGPLVVPNFVLREIQLISDSADPIKRNRGRRGLEMLNTLQKRDDLEVKISYIDYTETREVDAKLIKLAKDLNGKLITNDFNLNKVAELQDIDVLNINNLANALKPVVLPGEEMEVQVVKEGKDENQGIGYLDDGTMVVIENGGRMLGKKLKVNVTSVIQTNAGKMIFTKVVPKG